MVAIYSGQTAKIGGTRRPASQEELQDEFLSAKNRPGFRPNNKKKGIREKEVFAAKNS